MPVKSTRPKGEEKRNDKDICQLVMDNITDIVYIISLSQKIEYISPSVKDVLGYETKDLIGKKMSFFTTPESNQLQREEMKNYLKKNGLKSMIRPRKLEVEVFDKKGKKHWMEIHVRLIFDKNKLPKGIIGVVRDISEKKYIQKEIELHSEIVENMAEGVYLVGKKDGIIKYANYKFEKMFGYKPGEMIGKPVSIVNAPTEKDPVEIVQEIMKEIQKNGEWHGEVNNIKKDGTPFWCYANVSTFDHPKYGEVLISVHSDITDKKKLDDALEANKSLLSEAEKIAHLGSWIWEIKSNTMIWSDGLYKVFEMKPGSAKISFETYLKFVNPKDKERIKKNILGALKKGRFSNDVNLAVNGKKLVHHVEGRTYYKGKEPIKMIGTSLDITNLKKAKIELQESENKYKNLFDTMLNGFALLEMIYNKKGKAIDMRYVEVNPMHEKLTGLKTEKILGKTARESIPNLEQSWVDNYARVERTGKSMIVENYVSGLKKWYKVFVYRPKKGSVAVIFEDITEKKLAERTVQQQFEEVKKLNQFMIGRELKMAELKAKIKQLEELIH